MSKSINSSVGMLLIGCLLVGESGCGQRTPAVSDEATGHSAVTTHHSPLTAHQPDETFPFPADRGGRLLAENLRPSDQIPPLTDEKRIGPKRQSGPTKLENPDVPLPVVAVSPPASILFQQVKGKPVRPHLLQEEAPLSRARIDIPVFGMVKLPAGPKYAWPSPDVNQPTPLPTLARPVVDRASLDDPSGNVSQAEALASRVPDRTTPAPFLRLSLPDPFEHRNTVRLRTPPPEISLPTNTPRPPGASQRE
jgi:hypothetical protein